MDLPAPETTASWPPPRAPLRGQRGAEEGSNQVGCGGVARDSVLFWYPSSAAMALPPWSQIEAGCRGADTFQTLLQRATSGALQLTQAVGPNGISTSEGGNLSSPASVPEIGVGSGANPVLGAFVGLGDGTAASHDADDVQIAEDGLVETGEKELDGFGTVGGFFERESVGGQDTACQMCIDSVPSTSRDADQVPDHWPFGKALPADAPDSCQTKSVGAIERALRNAPNRKTKHIFEPVVGTKFNCIGEAQEFYNIYSWEVGFGTKKGDKHGNTMQELHCQCKGSDSRVQYKTKKTRCPAMVRLRRTTDFGWYVSVHRGEHNHPLAESCAEKLCWNSHGNIAQHTKEMIRYLRDNNVSLTKVNHIMGSLFGSGGEAPWSRNSITNLCRKIASEQRDNDVSKTLEVFKEMKEKDPGFCFAVDYDVNNRIKTLMWCGGKSRSQYAVFGDVVTFDTTYCTNIYKMPFGLFVGVNNHFQSTIFAGVLMVDERAESFKWVFEQFVELMGGQQPKTVLTDQCQAMRIAIRECWHGTDHLWCIWHVLRTAQEELGPIFNYGSPFHVEFSHIINDMLTIDEFEMAWGELLDNYNLRGNDFLERTFDKRKMWAKPYNKGVYCAGMTSTQRSESANYMLKQHVPRHSSMNMFVRNYNKLLMARYKAEDEAEHRTKQVVFVQARAWPIEIHAMQVYTNASYELFKSQVDKSTRYHVDATSDPSVYMVVHDKAKHRERWARSQFPVQVHDGAEFFDCECGLYSHLGIVCCHAIRVMLHLGVSRIPDRHIMNRWTRVARDALPPDMNFYHADALPVENLTYRHRLLSKNADRLKTEGDYDAETFDIATKHMNRAFIEIAEYRKLKDVSESDAANDNGTSDGSNEETDGEAVGNSYGAAGCSAGLSDSELLRMRPPEAKRGAHRPRVNRFKSRFDIIEKKLGKKKGGKGSKKKKSKIKCTECGLDGHKTSECHTKIVDDSITGLE